MTAKDQGPKQKFIMGGALAYPYYYVLDICTCLAVWV